MPRLAAFAVVGIVGFLLQITALAAMTLTLRWPYLAATAAAVELAVLHNFWWHERWTWRDRGLGRTDIARRFVRYHLSTGLSSIAGNVALTALFVQVVLVPPVAANAAAVVTMSVANYLLADRWVFARQPATVVAAFLLLPAAPAYAGGPAHETLAAWQRFVAAAESRHDPGQPLTPDDGPLGETVRIPGGTIHRWRGSIVIPGLTVERLVADLTDPGLPPPQPDVIESRVLRRAGDTLRVYLKLQRTALVTVTYDTEHDVVFRRHHQGLATSTSVSTRIAETGGGDRGFLWRLHSYWRYVQVGADVRVELESLSLSRSVPAVLRPVAGPIAGRIARESMVRTLESLRRFFAA
jgi:putative flippase GtrA